MYLILMLFALLRHVYADEIPTITSSFTLTSYVTITPPPPTGFASPTSLPASILAPYANASHAQSECCFLIQDTVTADYWAHFSTSTWFGLRRVISTVTSVTQYVDTIITNYVTTTTFKSTTYLTSWQIGMDNVGTYNAASGPYTTTSMINATATSIYGTLLTSPAGFYVIPSVKIIRAPAVTQSNGQLACATSSSWSLLCGDYSITTATVSTTRASALFSGMNNRVQEYFSGQQGPSLITIGTILETESHTATNTSAYPSTTVISFSTPFLFFPPDAATEAVMDEDIQILPFSISGMVVTTSSSPIFAPATPVPIPITPSAPPVDINNIDYGYLPSEIIPWILKNSDYVAQYPNLASCLIGGPSIEPPIGCSSAAAAVATEVPDLTTGSAITVKGLGCFHPGNCPAAPTGSSESGAAAAALPFQLASETTSPKAKSSVQALPEQDNPQPRPTGNPLSAIVPIPMAKSSDISQQASSSQQKVAPSRSQNEPVQTGGKKTPEQVSSQAALSQGVSVPAVSAAQPNPVPNSSPAPSPPRIVIGSSTIVADSSSNFVFKSHTISPGGSAIVISSSTFSLAPSATALIVNGQTSTLGLVTPSPYPSPSKPSTTGLGAIIAGAFGSHSGAASNVASQVVIGSETLIPGSSPIVVSGTTYSLAPSATAIIINGKSSALAGPSSPQIITINSQPISANSASRFIINSQTLAAGSPAITISGSTYSLAPSASAIIVNGHTSQLPPASPPQSAVSSNEEQVFTLASYLVTASPLSGSELVIGGSQTLSPGGSAVTISGIPISLPTLKSEIIVAGTTEALIAPTGGGSTNGNYSGPGFTGAGNTLKGKERRDLIIASMVAILGVSVLFLL